MSKKKYFFSGHAASCRIVKLFSVYHAMQRRTNINPPSDGFSSPQDFNQNRCLYFCVYQLSTGTKARRLHVSFSACGDGIICVPISDLGSGSLVPWGENEKCRRSSARLVAKFGTVGTV